MNDYFIRYPGDGVYRFFGRGNRELGAVARSIRRCYRKPDQVDVIFRPVKGEQVDFNFPGAEPVEEARARYQDDRGRRAMANGGFTL